MKFGQNNRQTNDETYIFNEQSPITLQQLHNYVHFIFVIALSFFDLLLLITLLVSSNFSFTLLDSPKHFVSVYIQDDYHHMESDIKPHTR